MVDDNHPLFQNLKYSLPRVVNAKLVIVVNQSILRNFQKIRIWVLKIYIFLVKFKCKRNHIQGLI
jgi:hypothetical protein